MALKGRRSRLFRRKPDMLLIDERLSTIVLPVLPTDHVFVDDEEDELLYAEEAENVAMESEPAAPLRVFLGANVNPDNDETDPVISSAWDLSSMVDDEDEDFSAPPASPPPIWLSTAPSTTSGSPASTKLARETTRVRLRPSRPASRAQ